MTNKTHLDRVVVAISGQHKIKLSRQTKTAARAKIFGLQTKITLLQELAVKTKNIAPIDHICNLKNVFREDKIGKSLTVSEALSNAPYQYKNFVKSKKVITSL